MTETPEQYTRRILGYMEGKDPLAVQAATAKKLDINHLRQIEEILARKFKPSSPSVRRRFLS